MTDITRDAEITTTEGQSGFPFIAATVLTIVVVCAAFGPWLAPHAADAISLRDAMTPPAWEEGGESGFLLGTDNLGRDILSRIIAGARVSVVIAAYAILLSGGIGAALGMIAGYFGGVPDSIFQDLSMYRCPFLLSPWLCCLPRSCRLAREWSS